MPPEVRVCPKCQEDAGFPNIRKAEQPEEINALNKRVLEAEKLADGRGTRLLLERFTAAVATSNVVMNRRLDDLNTWTNSRSRFFPSFHSQLRDGMISTQNEYDEQRTSPENTVNPTYYKQLEFAALSLDDRGMSYYGPYCVTLHESFIAKRATVFEENPFVFCKKHSVVSGSPAPLGYRATYANRATLARAKLAYKITASTTDSDFPEILMGINRNDEKCDFIEVQIFEKIDRAVIATVSGPNPSDQNDKLLWKLTRRKLESFSIQVHEK